MMGSSCFATFVACPRFLGDDAAVQEAEAEAKEVAKAKAKKKSEAKMPCFVRPEGSVFFFRILSVLLYSWE